MSRSYMEDFGDAQIEEDEINLARVHGIADPGIVRFRVMNPDSRMRLKITVAFTPDSGVAVDLTTLNSALYLGEEEQMRRRGKRVLCTDILRTVAGVVVHRSTPLAIPEDVGLNGFTIEFVTAADSIFGEFTTECPGGIDGYWAVKARWSPDGQHLCDRDWEFQRRKCRVAIIGNELIGGE